MIKITNINIKLAEVQLQLIQAWADNFIKTESEEMQQHTIKFGLHFADAVEWMDEVTRQRIFRTTNFYDILHYDQPEDIFKNVNVIFV